jgi:signal transduction histidine kinase
VIRVKSEASEGTIKVVFEDNGRGIEERDLDNMFQPFFTTKETGSGLGLFIVNQIIQAHSGYIKVESQPGRGTSFSVFLPIHAMKNISQRSKVTQL